VGVVGDVTSAVFARGTTFRGRGKSTPGALITIHKERLI